MIYQEAFLEKWHQFVETGNHGLLDDLLADDVVFHSPVVWTPQKGKALTKMYLGGAAIVLKNGFHYTRKIIQENQLALEFSCQVDDITVEGIDLIALDPSSGKIVDFKVMVRPLKAVRKMQEKMAELLEKYQGMMK